MTLQQTQRTFEGRLTEVASRSFGPVSCDLRNVVTSQDARSVLQVEEHTLVATIAGGADRVRVSFEGRSEYIGPKRWRSAGFIPAGRRMDSLWPASDLTYLVLRIPHANLERAIGAQMVGDHWLPQGDVAESFTRTALQELGATIARPRNPVDQLMAEAIVGSLELRIIQCFSTFPEPHASGFEPLGVTLDFIEQHLDRTITLHELTTVSGISRGRLTRAFRSATRMTPHRYVTSRRLARAQHLLATTGDPVSHVAAAVGCANASHLTALFRQHLAISPRAIRHRAGRIC